MAKNAGFSVQVLSANRLSPSGTGTGGLASMPSQRAAATGPIIAMLLQNRSVADAAAAGCPAARRNTASVDSPKAGRVGRGEHPGLGRERYGRRLAGFPRCLVCGHVRPSW